MVLTISVMVMVIIPAALHCIVTNSKNISSDELEYAKQNKVKIMVAKLHTNWPRLSDGSITGIEEVA